MISFASRAVLHKDRNSFARNIHEKFRPGVDVLWHNDMTRDDFVSVSNRLERLPGQSGRSTAISRQWYDL